MIKNNSGRIMSNRMDLGTLTAARKKLLLAASAVLLLMLAFPPVKRIYNGNLLESGHAFLLSIPWQFSVDAGGLLVQMLVVSAAAFAAYAALGAHE